MKKMNVYCLLALCAIFMFGCSKKTDVNVNKPIGEVKAEAEKMDVSQLKDMAMKYQAMLEAKKADVDKIAAQLKAIPVTELIGSKASKLKTDMDNLAKSMADLKERFDVYYNLLKQKGGDLTGLKQ